METSTLDIFTRAYPIDLIERKYRYLIELLPESEMPDEAYRFNPGGIPNHTEIFHSY